MDTCYTTFPRTASSGDDSLVAERIEGVFETPEGGLGALDYLKLDVPYERDRYCKECDAKARFLWIFELWNGHLGVCLSCGTWAVAPYTRTVEE